MKGKVYLVGAGPGDEGLMTLKGLQCLKEADVIVYDRLASERLLDVTRKGAEKIYAGKFASHHTLKQEEINALLAQKAQEGKVVVRLKGGDPFIFGRGGEEAEYLADQGIDFEVVPGVSSAYSVPAYAGIPVTQRGHTSTVAFITGHEDDTKEDSDIDWARISTGAGTLVFLMGVRNLELIVKNLIEYGRPQETPVAVIRGGTTPQQQTIVGTLSDIVDKVRDASLTPPAITVVGGVVRLREKLNWFEKRPLFGKTILVTRARLQASQLVEKLSQLGAQVIEFPTIKIVPPSSFGEMDQAIQDIARYDWIIFSSVNGVESFFQRLRELGRDVRELKGIKIAVVGPKTREKVEDMGIRVDLMPQEYRAEQILSELEKCGIEGKRFLIPRAKMARDLVPVELAGRGAEVDVVTAYETVMDDTPVQEVVELLQEGKVDVVTFTSSSTVKNFVHKLRGFDLTQFLNKVRIVCIGPITAQTARELGLSVDRIAEVYTIEGLIEAIVQLVS